MCLTRAIESQDYAIDLQKSTVNSKARNLTVFFLHVL